MKKKFLLASLFLALVIAASAIFAACNQNSSKSNFSKPETFYGFGAASTVKLLGKKTSVQAMTTFGKGLYATFTEEKSNEENEETSVAPPIDVEKFNEYFTAVDEFLSDDLLTTAIEENMDDAFPYLTKMTITTKDCDGATVNYCLYYTETQVSCEEDDGEKETKYRLEGVMVSNGVNYSVTGERKEEFENDETETELKIRAYKDLNDKPTFVEMKQELSEEDNETEIEYVYGIYENGVLLEETAIEFETETENGKTETEYEIEFRSGTAKGKYEISRIEKNGKTLIKVKYSANGKKGEFFIFKIVDESGEEKYEYTFKDGNVKVV